MSDAEVTGIRFVFALFMKGCTIEARFWDFTRHDSSALPAG
jgi:hypothetical protein